MVVRFLGCWFGGGMKEFVFRRTGGERRVIDELAGNVIALTIFLGSDHAGCGPILKTGDVNCRLGT